MLSCREIMATSGLALVLCLMGCTREKGDRSQTPPPPSPPLIAPVGNTGAGVLASLSSANRVVWTDHLKNIGTAYYAAALAGQPPKSVADLGQELLKQKQLIMDGSLVIRWGLDPSNATAGASNTVLGYVKDVPEKGGVVLMLDSSIRNMTPQEYANARKAGG